MKISRRRLIQLGAAFASANAATAQSTSPTAAEAGLAPGKPDNRLILLKGGTIVSPGWLAPRIAVIIDPWWEAHFKTQSDGEWEERWRRFYENCVSEERGSLRYLVTLLAAINGLPKHAKPVFPTKVRRTVGMNWVPYFSYHHLQIMIPGEERVLRAKQILDHERRNEIHRRRWHEVRGHWRVIEFGKRTHICRHTPTMVEHGLGICTRCELLVRWIPAFERGDQTLGVVDKTYTVTT